MSGDFDSVGAAVTAGGAQRGVEPVRAIAAQSGRGNRCLNCGTALVGAHCHRCGQKADLHRSFGAIGHDLVHAVFHFEGKLWNTLPLLVWRPGELTRRYIHGERASFISPLAMFLLAVFLTYAVLATMVSGSGLSDQMAKAATEQMRRNALETSFRAEVERIDARLAAPGTNPLDKASLVDERATLEKSADYLGIAREPTEEEREAGPPVLDDPFDQLATSADFIRRTRATTGIPFLDKTLEKATTNPGLLLYKLQANAYKFAWALIPLSLPFMWLLYPFSRRFRAYDHFVFVTYSISFMLLLFVAVRLSNLTILGEAANVGALLYGPFHLYRQLRGAYRSSRMGAAVRAMLLLVFGLFALVAFMLLLLALGLMG